MIFKYTKGSSREETLFPACSTGTRRNFSKKDVNDTEALEQIVWRECKRSEAEQARALLGLLWSM